MDNTQTSPNIAQEAQVVQQVPNKSNNAFKYVVIVISIFLILIIAVPVLAYIFFSAKVKDVVVDSDKVQDQENVKEEEKEEEVVKVPRANLFAWVENNSDNTKANVKVYYKDKVVDLYTKTLASGDYISIRSISEDGVLIDAYDSKNELYKHINVALDTKQATEVASSKEYMYMFTQYDDKYYFYVKQNEKNSSLYLYSANNKKSTFFFDIDVRTGGRGPAPYDTFKMSFTPDKSKMLFVNSDEIGNASARTTFVYNIDKKDNNFQINLIGKILNSAGSTWKDNDSLVYLKMTNEKPNGVYSYNTGTKQSTILKNVLNDGFDFSMNSDLDNMLYTKGSSVYNEEEILKGEDVYTYNFTTGENKKLMNANSAMWVGQYLVAVSKYKACVEVCEMSDYEFDNTEIIDTRDNSTLMKIESNITSYQD